MQADTATLNPSFSAREIQRAYRDDPIAAAAEYGATFRSDVQALIAQEVLRASVVEGRTELPPEVGEAGFEDFAGGSGGDSATCAFGKAKKTQGRTVFVVTAVREIRPPFSPSAVCVEFAALARARGVREVVADRWGGEFPAEHFRLAGVRVRPTTRTKSEIYREFLALINSGLVELPDIDRLIDQLAGLERRVARGGHESIDHRPNAHDDVANAVAGVVVELAHRERTGDSLLAKVVSDYGPGGRTVDFSERVAAAGLAETLALRHAARDRAEAE